LTKLKPAHYKIGFTFTNQQISTASKQPNRRLSRILHQLLHFSSHWTCKSPDFKPIQFKTPLFYDRWPQTIRMQKDPWDYGHHCLSPLHHRLFPANIVPQACWAAMPGPEVINSVLIPPQSSHSFPSVTSSSAADPAVYSRSCWEFILQSRYVPHQFLSPKISPPCIHLSKARALRTCSVCLWLA